MFARLTALVVHRRRWVLIASGAVLLGFALAAAGTFSVLKTGGFDNPSSGSSQARAVLNDRFGGAPNLVLLVAPADGNLNSAAGSAATVTADLRQDSAVDSVASWWTSHSDSLRSTDGRTGLITAHVTGDESQAAERARHIIDRVTTSSGPVTVRAGGQLGVGNDVTNQVGKDLAVAEAIAVPLTIILLLLAFGSVVAAALPLSVGLIAIAGAFATLDVLGHLTNVSTYAINLTTAMGLGLAVDYSLLIVNRFREELAAGRDTETAVGNTLRTAGRTVLFSSATVAVALAAMLVFPLYFLRSFAYAGIGVVLIAMLASLTTLPALLAVLGPRVNAGRVRRNRPVRAASEESRFWRRIATTVMRRPVLTAAPVILVLLVLGSPFLHISFATPDDRVLPSSLTSRQVGNELRSHYADNAAAADYVVIEGSPSTAAVRDYADRVSRLPSVTSVVDSTRVISQGTSVGPGQPGLTAAGVQYLIVNGPTDGGSAAAQRLVTDIRSLSGPAGGRVLVGGGPAELVDSKAGIAAGLPWAAAWIALSTFVLLFLFTGSVLLPVKALVLNVLSLSAVFGAMVWVFQDGHLSGPLGFTPGPINTSMPVLLFCIAFGLSMDYEVFLLSRIAEQRTLGAGNAEAVAAGLARTGRIVSTAAALLSVTFLAFGTSRVSFLQLFGIGTAIAIIIDATLVRGVLVPAFMRLAGDWNWWAPAPLARLHRRFGLSESDATTAEIRPLAVPVS
ncbi:MAG TPA: MMPL family transporter [Jatrophihabitans sp.]|nr:MMPL family transporter [Jatrophihabitans sp.]